MEEFKDDTTTMLYFYKQVCWFLYTLTFVNYS